MTHYHVWHFSRSTVNIATRLTHRICFLLSKNLKLIKIFFQVVSHRTTTGGDQLASSNYKGDFRMSLAMVLNFSWQSCCLNLNMFKTFVCLFFLSQNCRHLVHLKPFLIFFFLLQPPSICLKSIRDVFWNLDRALLWQKTCPGLKFKLMINISYLKTRTVPKVPFFIWRV